MKLISEDSCVTGMNGSEEVRICAPPPSGAKRTVPWCSMRLKEEGNTEPGSTRQLAAVRVR